METDKDHATMRESFSLVQNMLFIEYTDVFPAHVQENMVEKLWKPAAIWFGFLIAYFGGNLLPLLKYLLRDKCQGDLAPYNCAARFKAGC